MITDNPHHPGNPETDPIWALAYEQRTANLIAERDYLEQMPRDMQGDGWYEAMNDLLSQINSRLGTGPKP